MLVFCQWKQYNSAVEMSDFTELTVIQDPVV